MVRDLNKEPDTWMHSTLAIFYVNLLDSTAQKISAQIYTKKCVAIYFCIYHVIHSVIFKNQNISSASVWRGQYRSPWFKSEIELNIQIITARLLGQNWSEQVEEISILKRGSICLLAANVQTKIIPKVIKHFIFSRHSEPTLLVVAQAALLLGSLGLLLAYELNDCQGWI